MTSAAPVQTTSEKEIAAMFSTVPALVNLATFDAFKWYLPPVVVEMSDNERILFGISIVAGLVGIFFSIRCLFKYGFSSIRLAGCQIVNLLWLIYIWYALINYFPMPHPA